MASQPTGPDPRHVFVSYVREDIHKVRRLAYDMKAQSDGIEVWRDTEELWPGEDWKQKIRDAISKGAFAFLACFSSRSITKSVTYQNEELLLAIEQMRLRQPGTPWLIPVRFDDSVLPDLDLGGGRSLNDIQRVDLFGRARSKNVQRLIQAIGEIASSARDLNSDDMYHQVALKSADPNVRTPWYGPAYSRTLAFRGELLEIATESKVANGSWAKRWYQIRQRSDELHGKFAGGGYEPAEWVHDFNNFFLQCYYFGHWLYEDEATGLTMEDVKDFIYKNVALRICASLKRGSKDPTRSTAEIEAALVRAIIDNEKAWPYDKGQLGVEDALDLARRCTEAWDEYLLGYGLGS